MSTKDKLDRKKYIGMRRELWVHTAQMIALFPQTIARYWRRKRRERKAWNSGTVVDIQKANLVGLDWLRTGLLANMSPAKEQKVLNLPLLSCVIAQRTTVTITVTFDLELSISINFVISVLGMNA